MEQLAARLGVSWQTVQQWENGKTTPARKREEALAAALQCTVEYLLGIDKEPAITKYSVEEPTQHPYRKMITARDRVLDEITRNLQLLDDFALGAVLDKTRELLKSNSRDKQTMAS